MTLSALMIFDDSAQAKKVKDIEDKLDQLAKSSSAQSGYIHLAEMYESGTGGGDIDGGEWNVRPLNAVMAGESSVKQGMFLVDAGMWLVQGSFPAYRTDTHRVRLVRADTGQVLALGPSSYAPNDSENVVTTYLGGIVTLESPTRLRVEHWAETSSATNGMGYPADFGDPEIYGIVEFRRLG